MQVYSTVWPVNKVKSSIWQFMLLKIYSPFHSWVFYYLLTRYFESPFLRQSFNHSNHTVKKNILRRIDFFFGDSVVLLMSSKWFWRLLNCLYGIVMCLFFNFFFTTIITFSTGEKRQKKTLIQYKNKIQNNLIQKSNTN